MIANTFASIQVIAFIVFLATCIFMKNYVLYKVVIGISWHCEAIHHRRNILAWQEIKAIWKYIMIIQLYNYSLCDW